MFNNDNLSGFTIGNLIGIYDLLDDKDDYNCFDKDLDVYITKIKIHNELCKRSKNDLVSFLLNVIGK